MSWGLIIWFSVIGLLIIQKLDAVVKKLWEINAALRGNPQYRAD